jgi:hypothetical protein
MIWPELPVVIPASHQCLPCRNAFRRNPARLLLGREWATWLLSTHRWSSSEGPHVCAKLFMVW